MIHCHPGNSTNEFKVGQMLVVAHTGVGIDLQRVIVAAERSKKTN